MAWRYKNPKPRGLMAKEVSTNHTSRDYTGDRAFVAAYQSIERRQKAALKSPWAILPRYLLVHAAKTHAVSAGGHNFEVIERLEAAGHIQPDEALIAQAIEENNSKSKSAATGSTKKKKKAGSTTASSVSDGCPVKPRRPSRGILFGAAAVAWTAQLAEYEKAKRSWTAKKAAETRRKRKREEENKEDDENDDEEGEDTESKVTTTKKTRTNAAKHTSQEEPEAKRHKVVNVTKKPASASSKKKKQ